MSDLAQVIIALGLLAAFLVGVGYLLRPYRERWLAQQPDTRADCAELRQQVADLEVELRAERAARRLSDSKAEAYNALELEQLELLHRYDTDVVAARKSEHRMYLLLEAATRNVRGVREFLATLHADGLDTPPSGETHGAQSDTE